MQHGPCDTNRFISSASQELRNAKVCYFVQKNLPLVPILSKLSAVKVAPSPSYSLAPLILYHISVQGVFSASCSAHTRESLQQRIYIYIYIYICVCVCVCVCVPVPVAARSKAQVYGRAPAEIVGSNPTGAWTFVVTVVCCQVEVSATS